MNLTYGRPPRRLPFLPPERLTAQPPDSTFALPTRPPQYKWNYHAFHFIAFINIAITALVASVSILRTSRSIHLWSQPHHPITQPRAA